MYGFGQSANDILEENDVSTPEGYTDALMDSTFWYGNRAKNIQEVITNLQQQSYNSSEAQKARDFQMELSSTQYQRAVADMKKAGLNPASLTAGGISSGGSSSGSSGASSSNSHTDKGADGAKTAAAVGQFFLSLIKLVASA